MKTRRMLQLTLVTLAALAGVLALAPAQGVVVLYKLAQVFAGGLVGFWLDRLVAVYSRPGGYLVNPWQDGGEFRPGGADFPVVPGYRLVFVFATVRRAFLMAAGMLAMALGV